MQRIGENVVRIEAEALRALADRIAGPMADAFNRAVEMLFCCHGRVVVTGMGKSGIGRSNHAFHTRHCGIFVVLASRSV